MLRLTTIASARAYWYLRRNAPSNLMLTRLRSRRGLKWAIPSAAVLVPIYLYAASICTTLVTRGGPGWLNFLVLLFIWDALKFAVMAPVSVVLLARARTSERRGRSAAAVVPMGYRPGRSMAPWTTLP